MHIRSFTELTTPDMRSLSFTPLGLAPGGLSPENAVSFQQRSILTADLVPAVPQGVRESFERLRTLHTYGVLCYDLFTVVGDHAWIVLEQALRERFMTLYEEHIPLVKDGTVSTFHASTFEAVSDALRRGGSHAGWQLRLRATGKGIPFPQTLDPLLRWARQEQLLHGQRNRRLEELFPKMRNRFAHGGGFHINMPNHSARRIHDLAEMINRLWGATTPGGRLYPAPLTRTVLALGWSPTWSSQEKEGGVVVETLPTHIPAEYLAESTETGDWTYLLVRGVQDDPRLWYFDARYEFTLYPTELLWGPGTRADALNWVRAEAPRGDEIYYLDRVFALRQYGNTIDPPLRPDVLVGLPSEHRAGKWHVIRADFPDDAVAHIEHRVKGEPCGARGCAVEEISQGSWEQAVAKVRTFFPNLRATPYSEAHIPQRWLI